ncbi:MAG: Bug family tripartite tricarboxylate transporter substrate binding protein [Pseudorhodoplanes sp.]
MRHKTSDGRASISGMNRRNFLGGTLAAIATPSLAFGASDAWPNRPIRIIVPFAPGGTTDAIARVLGQKMSERIGQQIIIENRPGGGTNIGAEAVAKAAPDGYTLLMGTPSIAVNPALFATMTYDWERELIPIAMVGYLPNLLVVNPDLPVKSVRDLIDYARAHPGRLEFGSSGIGGAIHLSGELFKAMANVDMLHVPYKGSAPAMSDLLGGRIALMFDNLPSALPHVRAGKVRALAVTSSRRSIVAPEFPTVAESGLPGFEVLSWNGIFVPAGTAEDVVARLRTEIVSTMALPDVKTNAEKQGIETTGVDDFGAFVRSEASKWQPLARQIGLRAG